MENVKYILFDMDGVLINTEPLHYVIWKRCAKELGIELEYDIYKGCIGSTAEYLVDLIKDNYGVDFHNTNFISNFGKYKRECIMEGTGIPPIPGSAATVRKLYEKGYTLAVASSTKQEYIEASIKRLGVSDCFTLAFSAEFVEHSKPAPDVFLAAAEKIGAKPEECIVVEDSQNGVQAAKSAGMQCIGFINPDSGKQDLSKADQIIDNIEELLNIL